MAERQNPSMLQNSTHHRGALALLLLASLSLPLGCSDETSSPTSEAVSQTSNSGASSAVKRTSQPRSKQPPPSNMIKGGLANADHVDARIQLKLTEVIKPRRPEVLQCYELELEADHTLRGKLDIVLDIYESETLNVEIEGLTESLRDCVTERIAAWPFPGIVDARGIQLAYHLQPN